MKMEGYNSSYQNGAPSKEAEFQRLTQNIGSNIQKIIQNGKFLIMESFLVFCMIVYNKVGITIFIAWIANID